MRVQIEEYDPVSGRGFYRTAEGDLRRFRYTAFRNEEMIPAGQPADLSNGVLSPVQPTLRERIRAWWRAKWRS